MRGNEKESKKQRNYLLIIMGFKRNRFIRMSSAEEFVPPFILFAVVSQFVEIVHIQLEDLFN